MSNLKKNDNDAKGKKRRLVLFFSKKNTCITKRNKIKTPAGLLLFKLSLFFCSLMTKYVKIKTFVCL